MAAQTRISGCLGNVQEDARGRVAASVDKLELQLIKKCNTAGALVEDSLGGSCATAGDEGAVASCLAKKMACHSCQMMEGVFDLEMVCDQFDDQQINASCS